MASTTGDLLVERLIEWGVDTIFGLPGDGVNGLFESLRTHQDKLRFIQVRHEEAAAFAACGYAKFTGRLGVCIATSGPGGVHLANGLYDATMDGQPVLAITGHTFHDLIHTRQQQDIDLEKFFENVAVFSERVMGPEHVENAVDEAIRLALSRRAAANITIPKDVQNWNLDGRRSKRNVPGHSADIFDATHPIPPEKDLQRAADILNHGNKIVIMAGRGAIGARAELEQAADLLGAVIVKPLLGKQVVPDDSPYTTGGIGLLGTRPTEEAIADCDTLLIVGSSFPYEVFYPKPGQARGIQIDIDSSRIGLRYPVELGLPGNSRDVLQALMPLLQRKQDRSFLEKAQKNVSDWWHVMEERGTRGDMPMKPQVVSWELGKLLNDDAIVTSDTGTVTSWIAQEWKLHGNQMFTVSGNLATMAPGLPYAVGAQVAYPNRQVVAFVGDGGLTMLMGELATCVKYRLPIKIVVIKNNVLGEIKWEQMVMEGNPEYGVDLEPINFAKVAEACGMMGLAVDNPRDVPSVLREALAHPGPALVEAMVDPNEPPLPPGITRDQAIHFAESLAKGQPERMKIAETALKDYVRQVV